MPERRRDVEFTSPLPISARASDGEEKEEKGVSQAKTSQIIDPYEKMSAAGVTWCLSLSLCCTRSSTVGVGVAEGEEEEEEEEGFGVIE